MVAAALSERYTVAWKGVVMDKVCVYTRRPDFRHIHNEFDTKNARN
jgi:hypothetical protein